MSLAQDVRRYTLFRALIKRFILPILVVFMIDQGLSPAEIALITTLGTIVSFIFEVPSGSFSDTIGHKRSVILSMLGQAASMLCYLGGTFPWILAGSLLYWLSGTFMTGTAEALFYERLKKEGKEKEFAKYHGQGKGIANAVGIFSMIAAGFTYEIAWYLPFLIGALQFFVAAMIISKFTEPKEKVSVKKREGFSMFFSHFGETLKTIRKDRRIFWLMLTGASIAGPLYAMSDLQQALLTNAGVTATIIGIYYAGKRLLAVSSVSFIHKFMSRFSPTQTLAFFTVLGGATILLPTLYHLHIALTAAVVLGGAVTTDIALVSYLNDIIPSSSRATILSAGNLFQNLVQVICAFTFGLITTLLPLENGFQIIGGGALLLGVFSLLMLQKNLKVHPLN